MPIYEPGLQDLVRQNMAAGRLAFSSLAAEAVCFGELLFIAVDTPPDEDGQADLRQVLAVAESIGQNLSDYKVIINKSTVPVGTAGKVRARIDEVLAVRGLTLVFDVCSNPEFLKEGAAIEDFTRGARIVVGTDSERVRGLMRECYVPYNRNHEKMLFMDIGAAELTKYAANAMLATRISFMNEIANLAERLGVDIEQVRHGIGSDPRIGYDFIYPGCGYGGSCFPKDVQALSRTAELAGYDAPLLRAVETVNSRQKHVLFDKLSSALGGHLRGKLIAVWGLAFKPGTDDMREAPSLILIDALLAAGALIQAYDPKALHEAARIFSKCPGVSLVDARDKAVEGADALVICTEWKQFRVVDFEWLRGQLRNPLIVDGRNLYDPLEPAKAGLRYFAVGRGDSLVG